MSEYRMVSVRIIDLWNLARLASEGKANDCRMLLRLMAKRARNANPDVADMLAEMAGPGEVLRDSFGAEV